jgi:hypothetical protein
MSDQTNKLLAELLRWVRASSFSEVQKLIEKEFFKDGKLDPVKAKIYQLSDGTTTSVAIAKASKVGQSTVSRLWKKWRQIGVAEFAGEDSQQTRRCFSLDDFGFEVGSSEDEN